MLILEYFQGYDVISLTSAFKIDISSWHCPRQRAGQETVKYYSCSEHFGITWKASEFRGPIKSRAETLIPKGGRGTTYIYVCSSLKMKGIARSQMKPWKHRQLFPIINSFCHLYKSQMWNQNAELLSFAVVYQHFRIYPWIHGYYRKRPILMRYFLFWKCIETKRDKNLKE